MKKKLSIVLATSLAGLTLAGAGIASSIALTSCSSSSETSGYAMTSANSETIFTKIQGQLDKTPTAADVAAYNTYFSGQANAYKTLVGGALGANTIAAADVESVTIEATAATASSVTVNVTVKFVQGKVNLANAASTSQNITVSADKSSLVKNGMTFTPVASGDKEDAASPYSMTSANSETIFTKIQGQLDKTPTAADVAAYNTYFSGQADTYKALVGGALGADTITAADVESVTIEATAATASSVTVNVTVKFVQGKVNLANAASTSQNITVSADKSSLVKNGMTFTPVASGAQQR